MTKATRLQTDMSGWVPITRHYQVDGGFLAVTVKNFLGTTGTHIFYCDEFGGSLSMENLIELPDGTTHEEALQTLGYTVVDTIGPEPDRNLNDENTPPPVSVFDLLPPEIAARIQGTE